MKYKGIIYLIPLMLLLSSCEKMDYNHFGFNTDIKADSHALVIMDAKNNGTNILLIGNIKLDEGKIRLELIRPDGTKAFLEEIIAPAIVNFDEEFAFQSGYWRLSYWSKDGKGRIDLQIIN
jgi:hypothetical protein